MLLSGANKSIGSSTLASSSKSVIRPAQKKKENFLVYSFKQFWSLLAGFWTRLRKCMWVGSTGIYFTNLKVLSFL